MATACGSTTTSPTHDKNNKTGREESSLPPLLSTSLCTLHKDKNCDLYCRVHRQAVCTSCTNTVHLACVKQYVGEARGRKASSTGWPPVAAQEGSASEEQGPSPPSPSPFYSVEEAAHELSGQLASFLTNNLDERGKQLQERMERVSSLRQDIDHQKTRMIHELEADRDRLVNLANQRCAELVSSLVRAADHKDDLLRQQGAILEVKAQGLVKTAEGVKQGVAKNARDNEVRNYAETINRCHALLGQYHTTMEDSASTPITEMANLRLTLPPIDRVLEEIRTRGWAGEMQFDTDMWTLCGPDLADYSPGNPLSLTLRTKDDPATAALILSRGLIKVRARLLDGHGAALEEVDLASMVKDQGLVYRVVFMMTEKMNDKEVEVVATLDGQPVAGSPARVLITTNALGSTIFNQSNLHKTAIEALQSYFPNHELRLLYRASRDGWSSQDFHYKCDDQGPTVVVAKADNGTGSIFGGYTSQSWASSRGGSLHKRDTDSFLFTLINTAGLPPTKLPLKPKQEDKAIFCSSFVGPTWGKSSDLFICANANVSDGSCANLAGGGYVAPKGQHPHTFLAGTESFTLQEMEVFVVV